LRDLLALHEQIGQLVGTDAPGWTPPVDLYETATEFVLTAELPGLSRDQIEIHAEDNRIVIRGARASGPSGNEVPCEQYHRVERGHGRFSRAFALPEAIDVERVAADLGRSSHGGDSESRRGAGFTGCIWHKDLSWIADRCSSLQNLRFYLPFSSSSISYQ
jgi:HSP20 family molecular chaperone IbpA